jgi:hypothetical protein
MQRVLSFAFGCAMGLLALDLGHAQPAGERLPILHITAAASDEDFHGLGQQGHRLAIDCAADMDDDALVKKYQNKTAPVANR